jgi:hypothetical protein
MVIRWPLLRVHFILAQKLLEGDSPAGLSTSPRQALRQSHRQAQRQLKIIVAFSFYLFIIVKEKEQKSNGPEKEDS